MNSSLPASSSPSGPTRFRLAVVLLTMFCVVIAGKLLEDSLIERLRHDCASLFDDRLVPATTLFHLGDQMYLKRHLLQDYLDEAPGVDVKKIHYEMGQHDARLEGLIEQFQQTYLVEEESQLLQDFRKTLAEYQELEQSLIESKDDDVASRAALLEGFVKVRQTLLKLTEVQQRVGSQLRAESAANMSHMTSLLYLQLGIAFVLGLISSGLAMSLSRRPRRPGPEPDRGLH